MKNQARLDELVQQIDNLENRAADLNEEAYSLRTEKDNLIAQAIIEDKMLFDTTWDIQSNGVGSTSYLEFIGNIEGKIEEVVQIARKDYHQTFNLQPGIAIRFDDNDITLQFEDPKMILPFAKKNNLKLSGASITDRLSKLKREVAALEMLVHQFNL
jgi:hypothetical protein